MTTNYLDFFPLNKAPVCLSGVSVYNDVNRIILTVSFCWAVLQTLAYHQPLNGSSTGNADLTFMWDLSGRLVLNLKSGFKLPRSLAHRNWQIDAFLPNYSEPLWVAAHSVFIRWGEEWRGILFCADWYNLVKDLGPWAEWSREKHEFVCVCSKWSSCSRKRRKSFRWFVWPVWPRQWRSLPRLWSSWQSATRKTCLLINVKPRLLT